MDDSKRRQALIEGFINMEDMEALHEDGAEPRIFGREAGANGNLIAANNADDDGYADVVKQEYNIAKDYIEMDEDDPLAMVGAKLRGGELRENTNILKSAMHVFKANVGTGIFMIPTFYPDAGYAVGPVITILLGMVVIDCSHFLLNTKLIINRRNVSSYSQICRFVFGPPIQWFLFAALCLTQFGFCLMYSQLVSATMVQLVPKENLSKLWATLVFAICFPITCYSSNLSLLAISSTTATVALVYSLLSCITQSCMTIGANGGKAHPTCTKTGSDIPLSWFNNMANTMMSLEGIAIVLPVHAACTQKALVPRMLSIVLSSVVLLYLFFGMTGYLAYGTTLTTSLVAAMSFSPWGTSIRVMFVISVVLSYPLQFQSAMQLIDQIFRCRPRSRKGLGLRLFINLVILALSMGLGADAVNIVVGLIGALPSCCMVMIIPTMLISHVHYATDHPDEDRLSGHYWKMLFLTTPRITWVRVRGFLYFLLSILIMVIGTFMIIKGVITKK